MPSIYQLKPAFQNLLRPFVQLLYKSGITANQVTLLAMLISTCLGYFLYCYFHYGCSFVWPSMQLMAC